MHFRLVGGAEMHSRLVVDKKYYAPSPVSDRRYYSLASPTSRYYP